MTTIHADELRPGDVVDYHGQRHCVTHIDRHGGWSFPVAFDDAGWAIALGATDVVVVDRFSCEEQTRARRSQGSLTVSRHRPDPIARLPAPSAG